MENKIPLLDHIAAQLSAVWKMIMNAPEWRDEIDHSIDGIFRSGWSALICLPLISVNTISVRRAALLRPSAEEHLALAIPAWSFVFIEVASFYLSWVASIFLLVMIARNLGAQAKIADIIVGYNWLQLPLVLSIMVPVTLLATTGSDAIAGGIALPVLVFQIAALWGFVQRAFGAALGPNIAIIALLFLVSILISILMTMLISFIVPGAGI